MPENKDTHLSYQGVQITSWRNIFDKAEQKPAVTHWRSLALDPDTETVTYTVFMDEVQWPTKVSNGVTINVLRESFLLSPFIPQWYRFPTGPVAHVLAKGI